MPSPLRHRKEMARTPPHFRNTFFRTVLRAPKLLLQTSSAHSLLWWAGERFTGRISTRVTGMPARATCQAASVPARPAPITRTLNGSTACSLQHELQLAHCGTTDVERRPTCCQQDRSGDEDNPKIHWSPGEKRVSLYGQIRWLSPGFCLSL